MHVDIVVYHAQPTLTGGAGCLPASQPRARRQEKMMMEKINDMASRVDELLQAESACSTSGGARVQNSRALRARFARAARAARTRLVTIGPTAPWPARPRHCKSMLRFSTPSTHTAALGRPGAPEAGPGWDPGGSRGRQEVAQIVGLMKVF